MQHKAFAFDWTSFDRDLHAILVSALQDAEASHLVRFIDDNLDFIRDPYEGERLQPDWKTQLQNVDDVQELGDFALTRYYAPDSDAGIGGAWLDLDESIEQLRDKMLGHAIGPPDNLFDPGRMGSYFQTPALVAELSVGVQRVAHPYFVDFQTMLQGAVVNGSGLYVTF